MKPIVAITVMITIVFSFLNANAQPPWAKAYGHQKHGYRDERERWEQRRDYRREDDNDDDRGRYYKNNHGGYNKSNRRDYYYYPHANVYYSPNERNYYYLRNGVWISVNNLPRDIYLDQQYQEVYCNDDEDIWENNHCDVNYYRPAPRQVYAGPQGRPRVAVDVNLGVRF